MGASLFGAGIEIVGQYQTSGTHSPDTIPRDDGDRVRFDAQQIALVRRIMFQGKQIGGVAIRSDFAELNAFRGLHTRRLQVDEMWTWIHCKHRQVTPEIAAKHPDAGDIWLGVGIDVEMKLVPSFMLGPRTPPMAYAFMKDLASRVTGHTQLTTDGLYWYVDALDNAFGIDLDYAMLTKH